MPAGQSMDLAPRTSQDPQSTTDADAAHMLMSPPPEETLRATRKAANYSRLSATPDPGHTERPMAHATKRKRSVASSASSSRVTLSTVQDDNEEPYTTNVAESTPNPKARKQPKRSVSFAVPASRSASEPPATPTTPTKPSRKRGSVSPKKRATTQSPGQKNPKADYIPLSREHRSTRRRSATPIPPYEPPPDKFTPPIEVMYTPVQTHSPKPSSKRKSTGKKRLVLQIKKELPDDVNLNEPPPPPSPSDDPLLLHGPPPKPRRRKKSGIPHSPQAQDAIGESSRSPGHNHTLQSESAEDHDSAPQPAGPFDFSAGGDADDDWTSDEDFDHSGEYTGKYKLVTVPTKNDPPSSATRERQESWGRPISPFPRLRRFSPIPEQLHDEEMSEVPSSDVEEQGATCSGEHMSNPAATEADHKVHPTDVFESSSSPNSPEADSARRKSPTPPRVPPAGEAISRRSVIEITVEQDVVVEQAQDSIGPAEDTSTSAPIAEYTRVRFQDLFNTPSSDDEDLYAGHPVSSSPEPAHQVNDENKDTSVPDPVDQDPQVEESSSQKPESGHPTSPVVNTSPQVSPPSSEGTKPDDASPPSATEARHEDQPDLPAQPTGPTSPVVHESPAPRLSPAKESAQSERPRSRPRSPAQTMDIDDSEDEEDEVSVVRELSHPPDFDDNKEARMHDDILATDFARVTLASTPYPIQAVERSREIEEHTPLRPSQARLGKQRVRDSVEYTSSSNRLSELSLTDAIDGSDSESDDLDLDPKVVRIVSDDPMAAAKAAAILRLHRYNCLDESAFRKRRHSNPAVDAILRKARRKTTTEAGVSKSSRHRRSLGGIIGDKVIIPGSPAMTLPELLNQAETSLKIEDRSLSRDLSFTDSFSTPVKQIIRTSVTPIPAHRASVESGPREWSKDDWKLLDACYTDERLALGEQLGLGAESLASADDVNLENVVGRFMTIMGGEDSTTMLGPTWTRDHLLKRARALQRKQRSGNIAPPTPSRASSILSNSTTYHRYLSSTPRPPSSVTSDSTMLQESDSQLFDASTSSQQDVGYSRLMQEAMSVSKGEPSGKTAPGTPSSIANRVKGFLFSYLPTMKSSRVQQKAEASQKGLPMPPPEVFKKPRPPTLTPAPKPPAKPAAPKDLVHLNPAPPAKPSMIPRPTNNVRRFVELHHVPPPEPKPKPAPAPRERRDSGASVKDLVKTFEDFGRQEAAASRESLSRLSNRKVEAWANGQAPSKKPTWKP
ncbi:hypothetical protein K474DRAFT_1661547 [Panus rudis PR-1116 ss-1]|nr:hypothetical protein K474DRAFT_1661547 [Panus rudis PR-1116 ss-1]